MKTQKEKIWMLLFLLILFACLGLTAYAVVTIDPLFHFHAPLTDRYNYQLNHERSQNDGITRHFSYTGLITGTSQTENFRASEAEALFGGTFIKIPYAGASYKEINESVARALKRNPDVTTVIRGLDLEYLLEDKDWMRTDMGVFPTYLYDENPLNDIRYVLNRSVVFDRVCAMLSERESEGFRPGITSFDDYAVWHGTRPYGAKAVCPDGITQPEERTQGPLPEESRVRLLDGFRQNLTDLADQYPEVEFYFFFTPYSLAWWRDWVAAGTAGVWLGAEKTLAEEALKHPNIRLFSWNDRAEMTGNLDNYIDQTHYGPWISDQLLRNMREGVGRLTEENYEDFFEKEMNLYLTFDYASMNPG